MQNSKLIVPAIVALAIGTAPALAYAQDGREVPPPTIDTNGDGTPDAWDRDGDGRPDAADNDGDGEPDEM
jgi:hypothetical protein